MNSQRSPQRIGVTGVAGMVGSESVIDHRPPPEHDPARRRPCIDRAIELLEWSPVISLEEGLAATIEHFRSIA